MSVKIPDKGQPGGLCKRQPHSSRLLPFPDATFDVLYNGYMLDLLGLRDISIALGEFRRTLKPGGRLVLVNMTKADADWRTLHKKHSRVGNRNS